MNFKLVIHQTLIGITILIFFSCSKLTDVESPKNQLTTDKVFADTNGVKAALFNIYVKFENLQDPVCNQFLSIYADESVSLNNQNWNQSRISADDGFNQNNWTYLYSVIYQCNMILEQTTISSQLTWEFKTKIQGEARFLRAYAYFFLVNLYGKVPLLLTTSLDENRKAPQQDSGVIYTQVINDLVQAREQLPSSYQGTGKFRANKACATALLARVYLYQSNWAMAESLANELINSNIYTPLESPVNVFKANSKESILQLSTQKGYVTAIEGMIPSTSTEIPGLFFTDNFYNSFETGDLRKINWTKANTVINNNSTTVYGYPFKYQNNTVNSSNPENLIVLRIAEQYLIRAEARARQNKISGQNSATDDINSLRKRAGLSEINPIGLDETLQAIYTERRHEMFFENGDRFLNLKRTGNLQHIMTSLKPTWISSAALLPIPIKEITYNANLIQNDGY
ncbi:RagB/SusD family nutrient uptake outer membrane protein [Pedobacter sp. N36a]|uniref:RagB/SusD family nutrient uptake outer membrane protein n=1 Tax=Pedobacter sp. N36a TaxID=2767996 RepID=UPI001656D578|nr:RagB/SusD family nutrient uptake outer membrane protein [Pedobacter sp. N36a]MBC8986678.1 RagB/SusD family nutrient uptake outer membrane protein [Pedobacter sp. N36a]